jgi:RNA polymerase sigma factor (sigma-70 family)
MRLKPILNIPTYRLRKVVNMEKMTDIELLERYKETKSIEYRNQIITNNMQLLKYYAHHYICYNHSHEFDDLLSFACIGAIDAIDYYIKRNVFIDKDFRGALCCRVKWGVLRGVKEESYIPNQHFFDTNRKEEYRVSKGIHLISEIESNTKTPEEMFLENEQNDCFIDLLNSLPKQKREVMYYRSLQMGFEEIGNIMHITKQAVHQHYKKGLQYMWNEIKHNPKYSNLTLDEYNI